MGEREIVKGNDALCSSAWHVLNVRELIRPADTGFLLDVHPATSFSLAVKSKIDDQCRVSFDFFCSLLLSDAIATAA